MILLIVFDYFKTDVKDYVYNNILIISCIAGVLGCIWQINSCKYSLEYATNFKNKLTNNEGIVYFDNKDKKQAYATYDLCFGTLQRSLILTPAYEMKSIVLPKKNTDDYERCMLYTFYEKEKDSISLQSNYMPVKNKYHNMSAIIPYIQEIEKELAKEK